MSTKKNPSQNTSFGITVTPSAEWRVKEVIPLKGFRLSVQFNDGTQGEVDMSKLIKDKKAGIFTQLADTDFFNKVHLEYGVVTWPNEIDLAPDVMYDEIKQHGKWIPH